MTRVAASLFILFAVLTVARSAGTLTSVFATFNSIGITVDISDSDDPSQTGSASVQYRLINSQTWLNGHPLVRTTSTRYVGSIMWLKENTSYDVKVRVSTDSADLTQTIKTRAESEVQLPNSTRSYHVSPTGSDSECTEQFPCSLATAIEFVNAGEEIVLKDGVYYEGELSLYNSRGATKFVVIRGSRKAILDGSDPTTFTWTNVGGTVYKTTVSVPDTQVVVASGKRLFRHNTLAGLQTLDKKSPGFYVEGYDFYINLAGMTQTDPALAGVKISRFVYCFQSANYIYYHGFTMRYYGVEDYGKGIYMDTASNNVVSNMYFEHNDASVALKRPSYNNVVQDCEFFDTKYEFLWESVKEGSAYETAPVNIFATDGQSGRGLVVRRNKFEGFFDSIQPVGGFAENNLPVEMDCHDNIITKSADDAISLDGTCSNCRVWGNKIDNSLTAFSMAPIDEGPVFIVRNLAYNLQGSRSDGEYAGMAIKLNSDYSTKGKMFVYHNTFDMRVDDTIGLDIKTPGTWNLVTLRNNIFWAAGTFAIYNVNTDEPMDMDYDLFYTTKSDDIIKWDERYPTFANFTAATSQETHGYFAMPLFNDRDNGDYRLTSASIPQIDKGVVIPGINNNYKDSAPDLGCFEFDGTALPPNTPQSTTPSASPSAASPSASPSSSASPTPSAGTPTNNASPNGSSNTPESTNATSSAAANVVAWISIIALFLIC